MYYDLGRLNRKTAFKHAQNAQIQIIFECAKYHLGLLLSTHKVSSV